MDAKGSYVGTPNIELFISTLFKLLDIQNGTETKVTIKKRPSVTADGQK